MALKTDITHPEFQSKAVIKIGMDTVRQPRITK